ncbi:hypothetical protein ACA910_013706 [Epithemia clementina (nom. ined.)]
MVSSGEEEDVDPRQEKAKKNETEENTRIKSPMCKQQHQFQNVPISSLGFPDYATVPVSVLLAVDDDVAVVSTNAAEPGPKNPNM